MRFSRKRGVAVAALTCALALAACSGDGGGSGNGTASTGGFDPGTTSGPAWGMPADTGALIWNRSGCDTGTDSRISAVTGVRLPLSTYSYLKLTVMPWAPLLQVGTACMGSCWVWVLPGARSL